MRVAWKDMETAVGMWIEYDHCTAPGLFVDHWPSERAVTLCGTRTANCSGVFAAALMRGRRSICSVSPCAAKEIELASNNAAIRITNLMIAMDRPRRLY